MPPRENPTRPNPMSAALNQGAARRRVAGEQAGPPPMPEEEKLMTVSIPKAKHAELKALCAQLNITLKEVVNRGIDHEMAAIRRRLEG